VAEAITTLSIISLVSLPLTNLMGSYPNLMSAVGCFDRIQKYLLSEDREDHRLSYPCHSGRFQTRAETPPAKQGIELQELQTKSPLRTEQSIDGNVMVVEDGSFGLGSGESPILRDINIRFPRSSFTMIVGPVGSGKSIMLKSLLEEVPSSKGFVRITSTAISYCDQASWLINATVRQNILKQSTFKETWYKTVIRACALNDDLTQFPDGDESVAGSGGITLSGGQKQRLVCISLFNLILALLSVFRRWHERCIREALSPSLTTSLGVLIITLRRLFSVTYLIAMASFVAWELQLYWPSMQVSLGMSVDRLAGILSNSTDTPQCTI
jgi:ATP-binding cassette, subfamily C (CFTR/MRP), member 1